MILICSASYIDQDLATEVGRLPPAFLPIGNKRLFEHQVDFLRPLQDAIYISLPKSFTPSVFDLNLFKILNVSIIYVPDGLSLGNSILFCWAAVGINIDSITILHGDTLFSEVCPLGSDYLSVHRNYGSYSRARIENTSSEVSQYVNDFVDDSQFVLSGLFSFSVPQLLMQGILHESGDFIKAIDSYSKKRVLLHKSEGVWLDFGHLNSFFKSRSLLTTQRAFNDLAISPHVVKKSSSDHRKMLGEVNWFKSIPLNFRLYTPALIEDFSGNEEGKGYALEYLYLLPLSDLYVFGRLTTSFWEYVLNLSYSIIDKFSHCKPDSINLDSLNRLYKEKTFSRLNQLIQTDFWNVVVDYGFVGAEDLFTIVDVSCAYIKSVDEADVGIVHGDFCFSNILYDSRTEVLKLIDPRGVDCDGVLTIFGDSRYDVAKLYHSAVSCYDFIICGRYEVHGSDIIFYDSDRIEIMEGLFDSIFFDSGVFIKNEIIAINVLLFISMLPLHSDRPDRQLAMLLNALRLYKKLCNLNS